MAETIFRGADVNAGSLLDGRVEPFDGPSVNYQSSVIPIVLFSPIAKDGLSPGRVPVVLNSPYVVMVDQIPQAASTTLLATAQVATSGIALTLATSSVSGSAPANATTVFGSQAAALVPLIATGTTVVQNVIALDFGFQTGTTVANSSTVVVADSEYFSLGQWIVIGGAGNATLSAPLIAQVLSIANATTITIAPNAATAFTRAPIGQANLFSQLLNPGTQFGPSPPKATAVYPYSLAGLTAVLNPLESLARNLSVTGNTSIATAQLLVTGYDIYFNLMHELITASGTTTVYGKKAFKYVASIVPQQTQTAANFSVGVGDVFGFHQRSDKWEYTNIFYSGSFATANTGWLAAAAPPLTTLSTATTGDVRGTVQVSVNGSLGTSFFNTPSNGTSRLTLMMSVPLFNIINATPINTVPEYGLAQA